MAAAKEGDAVALGILAEAGDELALAAVTVIRKLHLEREAFDVATVGGVFSAGELILGPLRDRIRSAAPGARLHPPLYPPEIGAVRLALARAGVPR
jgi:N-acetylglucosamine kinase-like BadF-type ATPase